MKQIFKIARIGVYALATIFLVGAILGAFIPEVAGFMTIVFGDEGVGLLAVSTAIAGEPVTAQGVRELTSDLHQERDVSTIVTKIRPDEFPLDTMIRSIRKSANAKNQKVEFETVEYRKRQDTTNGLFTAAGTDADKSVVLGVDDINMWGNNDEIYVEDEIGWDGTPLRLLVVAVDRSASTLRVTAVNGASEANFQRVPSLEDGTVIRRLGNAKQEIDSLTDVVTQYPTQDHNYCQIHMAYLEQSEVNAKYKAYSGYSYEDLVMMELYDFRSSLNYTSWFGKKALIVDPTNNKKIYKADGIWDKITKVVTYGPGGGTNTMTVANVLNMIKQAFTDNAGSSKRVLFAGSGVIEAVQNISFEKNQMAKETEMVHGVTCTKLISDFGTVFIKYDKSLDQMGKQNEAALIDLENVVKHDFEKMQRKAIDLDTAGIRRVKNAYRLLEHSCLTLRYPDTHLIWKVKTAT